MTKKATATSSAANQAILQNAIQSAYFKQEFDSLHFSPSGLSGQFQYNAEALDEYLLCMQLRFPQYIIPANGDEDYQMTVVSDNNKADIIHQVQHLPMINDRISELEYTANQNDECQNETLPILLLCAGEDGIQQGYASFKVYVSHKNENLLFHVALDSLYVYPKFNKTKAWAALSFAVARLSSAMMEAIYVNATDKLRISPKVSVFYDEDIVQDTQCGIFIELDTSLVYLQDDIPNPLVSIDSFEINLIDYQPMDSQ